MALATKEIGVIGLGNMGKNIAQRLHDNGYSLVLYDRTKDKYVPFEGKDRVYLAADTQDLVAKLKSSTNNAIVWLMVTGGAPTNAVVAELSILLRKDDIVIDGSNSIYLDSIANYNMLKGKGIFYLDVGCAGGPDDLLKAVALMVGGDKAAFESVEDVFKVVCGSGAYGYVGSSGSGHMTKLVHNGIFYGIFPVYAEGIELLQCMKGGKEDYDIDIALRLLASSPPINKGIMEAISDAIIGNKLPDNAPQMKLSEMVSWELKRAEELGIRLDATRSVLERYASMSEGSRKIYTGAKRKLTGH